ncbi:MAG: hypothetical protein KAJ19_27765 [Gammaproteobacteria bacterium]|nr:hypothetical protein [Gammaproteobacteria bacterium]
MKIYKVVILVLLAGFILSVSGDITAGPTVIRDNRITDIGIAPVLGRGYTISTNTLQSICMENVKKTEPSYDFTYKFIEIKGKGDSQKTTSKDNVEIPMSTVYNRSFNNYIQKIRKKKGKLTTVNNKTYENKYLMVVMDMDMYYSSVDESASPLSEKASALLDRKDLPGFFSACGSYYIRTINRNAKFISVFSWKQDTTDTATDFSGVIETQLKRFKRTVQSKSNYKYVPVYGWKSQPYRSCSWRKRW